MDGHGLGHEHTHAHGLVTPPTDEVLAMAARESVGAGADESTPPHHWQRGPMDLHPVATPYRLRLRTGVHQTITHRMYWQLDRVTGTTRSRAASRLYDVLLDPRGWVRAGVHWQRVGWRTDADIIVRVIPRDETVCGPGSGGCYSWGYEPDRKPVAEVGVEYIDRDGPWQMLVGMELQGHGAFRMHDGYINHPGYEGVLGSWEAAARVGYRPSAAELDGARLWLGGQTPADLIHGHG